jgi:hypothetical protein
LPSKRIKVSEEEEELLLKLRRDRKIYNEGIQKVIDYIRGHKAYQTGSEAFLAEIELLKKETF